MNNELGSEDEELNNILNAIELNASIRSNGVNICQIGTDNYKIIVNANRIVTLYPNLD